MPEVPRENDPEFSQQRKKHNKYVTKTYEKQKNVSI